MGERDDREHPILPVLIYHRNGCNVKLFTVPENINEVKSKKRVLRPRAHIVFNKRVIFYKKTLELTNVLQK